VINYYDFLLVAKKLNFRFEESAHLMELRKYFFSHKNQLLNKKLSALLCIEEQSLADVVPEHTPDKMYYSPYIASSGLEWAIRSSQSKNSQTKTRKVGISLCRAVRGRRG
jgi:hypothetical protein